MKYELHDPITEAGFGINDDNCAALAATVYEYIWPSSTLLSLPHASTSSSCARFPNICTSPFLCVPDVALGYRCLPPINIHYDLELEEWSSGSTCPAEKYGLDSTDVGPALLCTTCASECAQGFYELLPCSTATNRGCSLCSFCDLGFTMVTPCQRQSDAVCEDRTPPVLILFGPTEMSLEFGTAFDEPGYAAMDRSLSVNVVVTVTPNFVTVCAGPSDNLLHVVILIHTHSSELICTGPWSAHYPLHCNGYGEPKCLEAACCASRRHHCPDNHTLNPFQFHP